MTTNAPGDQDLRKLQLLSIAQLRQILPASSMTYWRWAKKGVLKPVRIGGRRYWRRSDIERLMAEAAHD